MVNEQTGLLHELGTAQLATHWRNFLERIINWVCGTSSYQHTNIRYNSHKYYLVE